jgi:hypothetical protein
MSFAVLKNMQWTKLSLSQILRWADAYHKRSRRWPTMESGTIREAPELTWRRVDNALRLGFRGLAGGSSLARLLEAERDVAILANRPPLTIAQILSWADSEQRRTGKWPTSESGKVAGTNEKWKGIDSALREGYRGLPGGSSLAQLLAQRRGVRNLKALPRLTIKQILIWADAHYRTQGVWPTATGGRVLHAPGETWTGIDAALSIGRRGLPGGDSLPRLLARHRGVRNLKALPTLQVKEILRWADAHYRRTGQRPHRNSGPIPEAAGDTWSIVDQALSDGKRGLRGGSSLYRLLQKTFQASVPRATI